LSGPLKAWLVALKELSLLAFKGALPNPVAR